MGTLNEIVWVGAVFAALLGLAFGSFLNVCLTRLPAGESVVAPRSHCRECEHSLAWWENLPLLSWVLLRGRCRECRSWIGIRYPLVELAVGLLWAGCWTRFHPSLAISSFDSAPIAGWAFSMIRILGFAVLCWQLVALAALDVEYFWLPDVLTLPGIALGFVFTLLRNWSSFQNERVSLVHAAANSLFAIFAGAGLVLLIRLAYWVARRQEGIGLGDAKLMAMMGAWLGLIGAMESFALAAVGATGAALVWLVVLAIRRKAGEWAQMPLPLGTFLCVAALGEIFYPEWLWNALGYNGLFR